MYTIQDKKDYASWLKSEIGKEQKAVAKNSKDDTIKHYNLYQLEQDLLHTKKELLVMTINR